MMCVRTILIWGVRKLTFKVYVFFTRLSDLVGVLDWRGLQSALWDSGFKWEPFCLQLKRWLLVWRSSNNSSKRRWWGRPLWLPTRPWFSISSLNKSSRHRWECNRLLNVAILACRIIVEVKAQVPDSSMWYVYCRFTQFSVPAWSSHGDCTCYIGDITSAVS